MASLGHNELIKSQHYNTRRLWVQLYLFYWNTQWNSQWFDAKCNEDWLIVWLTIHLHGLSKACISRRTNLPLFTHQLDYWTKRNSGIVFMHQIRCWLQKPCDRCRFSFNRSMIADSSSANITIKVFPSKRALKYCVFHNTLFVIQIAIITTRSTC